MMCISQSQLLHVWSELDDAYYGKNGFGSYTAEIYAYTLAEYHPNGNKQFIDPAETKGTLCKILEYFAEYRNVDVYIEEKPFIVNGKRVDHWFWNSAFDYRVHVTIKHKEGDKNE